MKIKIETEIKWKRVIGLLMGLLWFVSVFAISYYNQSFGRWYLCGWLGSIIFFIGLALVGSD